MTPRTGECDIPRFSYAPVLFQGNKRNPGIRSRHLVNYLHGAIGGGIVDNYQLKVRHALLQHRAYGIAQVGFRVANRHDNAYQGIHANRYASFQSRIASKFRRQLFLSCNMKNRRSRLR